MRAPSILIPASAVIAAIAASGCKHDLDEVPPAGEGGGPPGEGGSGERVACSNEGDRRPCSCPGGEEIEQECMPDGFWSECECPGSGGGGGSGGSGGSEGGSGGGEDASVADGETERCDDTCELSQNGECDEPDRCEPGTDCTDCTTDVTAGLICEPSCIADDVETACRNLCNLRCDRLEQFCFNRDSVCKDRGRACAVGGEGVNRCIEDCLGDLDCVRQECEALMGNSCGEFSYECQAGGNLCDPDDETCRNTCPTSGDGECNDGGERSADDTCIWGTDCDDCGVREANPPFCSAIGCACDRQRDCCGFLHGGWAFCVERGDGVDVCMEDCTESQKCPPGFKCQRLTGEMQGAFACTPRQFL
jgi:hypothetical protein